ncbi:Uncharacterised protein g1182 [Pycnogonum litorale]
MRFLRIALLTILCEPFAKADENKTGCSAWNADNELCHCATHPTGSEHVFLVSCEGLTGNNVVMTNGLRGDGLRVVQFIIANSNLATIKGDSFRGMSIDELRFRNVTLLESDIVSVLLSKITNLKTLYLESTSITSVPGLLAELKSLKRLEIQKHSITKIKSTDFKGMTGLLTLTMKKGELAIIMDGAFDDLTSLRQLLMSSNKLASLPSMLLRKLVQLKKIDFSDNLISEIPASFFDKEVGHETNINFKKNKLVTIAENVFKNVIAHNATINLRENPIKCNKNLCWLQKLIKETEDRRVINGKCETGISVTEASLEC